MAAIALVWIGHSGFFSIGLNPKVMEFWSGIFCLEVFFALSGFLVGRSLTITSRNPGPAFKKCCLNRLIRTIPLYYLALLALWASTRQRPPLSCFLFLQNFSGADLGYFPPSWSLPVEAWFYFLIPPVFFLLYRLFSRKHRFLLISVAGMAALYGWYLADLWDHFDDSNLGRILIFTLVPILCCLLVSCLRRKSSGAPSWRRESALLSVI